MFSVSKQSTKNGTNKTAAHKEYHRRVAELGCIISSDQNVQIHHIWGAKAQVKSTTWGSYHVGEFAVLPLHPLHHHGQLYHQARAIGWGNVHGNKSEFEKMHGTELELFTKMVQMYAERWGDDEYLDDIAIKLILDQ